MIPPDCRPHDWPERLAALIAVRRRTPFAWGGHDCCRWALDGVAAVTGHDAADRLRLRYRTETGAAAAMARLAGRAGATVEDAAIAVAECFGLPEVGVLTARRGDVVLADVPGPDNQARPALGLVAGRQALFARWPAGLLDLPVKACRRAWRIG